MKKYKCIEDRRGKVSMQKFLKEREKLIKKYGRKKFELIENFLLDMWEHYGKR